MSKSSIVVLTLMGALVTAPRAHAQWAVIDVNAIAQLAKELQQMQAQYQQMQAQYQAMTGTRGMQGLLGGVNRNYLPGQWNQLAASLAGPVNATLSANAVLSAAQLAALSPSSRALVLAARQNAAVLQVASETAYANSSARFASLQQLINAIGLTTDQKAALELQARTQGEISMLQNEGTKLAVLFQAAQGQGWALRQRTMEQAVADIGSLRSLPPLALP